MFRSHSPFENDVGSYTESMQSTGYPTMFEGSSQTSDLSRPSAKSIYLQRKEYSASINTVMNKVQHRVEHLLTCEVDGRELRSLADCVERLKSLEELDRVWGQSMLLEVHGPKLLLKDIETKTELESVALSDIAELKAVLDSGTFHSLLTISVQTSRKRTTIFMFQCEDVRADSVQRDLSRAISHYSRNGSEELTSGHQGMKNQNNTKSFEPKPAVNYRWTPYEEDNISVPEAFASEDEGGPFTRPELAGRQTTTEQDRDIDILNHILSDMEIFMVQVGAALDKKGKKKKMKRKQKKGKAEDSMPAPEEFASCLHKIKCGFNLLAELNGKVNNPSAPEFVHFLFATLAFVEPHCPLGLPQSIRVPQLTPQCVRMLSEEVTPEENLLWKLLGDAWTTPSNNWRKDDTDTPANTLEYFDRWQPSEMSATPEPLRRLDSPPPASGQNSASWRPSPQQDGRSAEPRQRLMRVMYDFASRNSRELTVRKGEIVELLDPSRQWWKVRDSRGEEGFVPNNVLEPHEEPPIQFPPRTRGSVVLTKRSRPAEVKAWLEDKGFSNITVRCLGGLSGSMLLGMSREELKEVCPEEGGRVFFKLQAVKSSIAVAS